VAKNNILYVSLVISLLIAFFSISLLQKKQPSEDALIIELKRCEKLTNESKQIACLEKLMTRSEKELAQIEDLKGALEFQRINILEPKGHLFRAKKHFEKAIELDPSNQQYKKNLEEINELIEDKF
jgi:hypothetical protein